MHCIVPNTTCRNNISIRYRPDNGGKWPNINGRKGLRYRIKGDETNECRN